MSRRPEHAPVLAHFERDVAQHEMTVLRDDGIDRHLRFKRPGSSSFWFDVLTWEGRLYIGGDCGCYVFDRLTDMFQFFRADLGDINPDYWQEKVEASCRDGVKEFKWDEFLADLKDHVDQCFHVEEASECDPDFVTEEIADQKAKRAAMWAAVEEALSWTSSDDEYTAVTFIRDFEHDGWRFQDWERDSKVFTHRFLWNCYAIVWAIDKYDAHRAKADTLVKAHCAQFEVAP